MQRRLEVVGYRVGKGFEFLVVRRRQFLGPCQHPRFEVRIERADLLLETLSLGDVVDHRDAARMPLKVDVVGARLDDDLAAILAQMPPFPM